MNHYLCDDVNATEVQGYLTDLGLTRNHFSHSLKSTLISHTIKMQSDTATDVQSHESCGAGRYD